MWIIPLLLTTFGHQVGNMPSMPHVACTSATPTTVVEEHNELVKVIECVCDDGSVCTTCFGVHAPSKHVACVGMGKEQ